MPALQARRKRLRAHRVNDVNSINNGVQTYVGRRIYFATNLHKQAFYSDRIKNMLMFKPRDLAFRGVYIIEYYLRSKIANVQICHKYLTFFHGFVKISIE